MQPIFKEQIKMWSDLGYDIPIKEGTYWLDHGIVKAFDKQSGRLLNLYKYTVSDDLNINIKEHADFKKNKDNKFETWQETINRFSDHIEELESESIKSLKDNLKKYQNYNLYALTSTGKDSSVVVDLCKKIKSDIQVVFNNTSLDCVDTYKIVKSNSDWIITNPDEGFYQWISRINYIPSRMDRACCTKFKEGNNIDYFKNIKDAIWVSGLRNSESSTRSEYQDVQVNPKWIDNKLNWKMLLPIRSWTNLDVWLYMFKYNLEINTKYKKGYSRVGCAVACPYYTKSTWVLDKYWYPKMYQRWHKIIENDFIDNQRWGQLNCTKSEYHSCWNGGLLRKEPTEEVVSELMNYKNIEDKDVALQYFNKTCYKCGTIDKPKNIRQKDVIAMNMKMFGRNINKFMCRKCLMKEFNWTKEDWNNQIQKFKKQGCALF